MSSVYEAMGNLEAAEIFILRYYSINEKLLDNKSYDYSNVLSNVADLYLRISKFTEALQFYQKALTVREQLGDNQLHVAATYNDIASVYTSLSRYDEAYTLLMKA